MSEAVPLESDDALPSAARDTGRPRIQQTQLSEVDLRIAQALSIVGRMPTNLIARNLELSDHIVRTRLQQMEENGILRVVGRPNPFHFGYSFSAILAIDVEFGTVERVAGYVERLPEITVSNVVAGRFDLFAWTTLHSRDELRTLHRKLAEGPGIRNCETLVVLRTRKALLGRVSLEAIPQLPPFQRPDRPVSLDAMDLQICRRLMRSARTPQTEIARALGAPVTTVHRKMHRVLDQDTIRPEVFPDLKAFGFDVEAVIGIRVAARQMGKVVHRLFALPDVNYLARVTGRYDLIARVIVPNFDDLQEFLDVDLSEVDGIEAIESQAVLETTTQRFVRVGEAGPAAEAEENP
jgi:DNA-binding Lrp family transcriptional regulator